MGTVSTVLFRILYSTRLSKYSVGSVPPTPLLYTDTAHVILCMRSSDHYGSHRLLTDPCLHRIDGGSGSSIESFWDNAAVVVPAVYKEWLSRNTSDGSKQIPPTWLVEQYSVYLYQRWDASAPCHCPNRGYESGIFLRFLSDHYSRLPSVVAFVQADWLQEARMRPPVAFDFWQPRCMLEGSAIHASSRWMPLGKRHTCWPPGQMRRGSSYWPNKRSHASGLLIEACWHELLGMFEQRPPSQSTRLNLTFYPFQNFLASREQLLAHPHSSYHFAYERLVLNGTCLSPPSQLWPRPSGEKVLVSDALAHNKETAGKGMEHLMHAIFGGQPAEHAPPARIPANKMCIEQASSQGAACQMRGL